ncbi:pyrroloquinoline-quinone synthase PqqC [Halomonas sp. QX-1]|uniref:Pyrroloquinoline-quinone synthase n=2 Tax=Vreelandella maris TaxID=2729617 RepID=A0A7Y6R9P2_9GAMM|nr:pyrroloquinoline-quinone synthase PqqC [Halomonas maris]|tara:strand:- start:13834 stop:14631 length:798 start_codon:yes stop_codon:yes gene_type:complete
MTSIASPLDSKQMDSKQNGPALDRDAFRAALMAKGAYYHIHHPYQVDMAQGRSTPEQIRGWVANRFYYQINIPQKDAALLANCPDAATRRRWVQRLLDHDGYQENGGGIEAWLTLGEAVGMTREELWSQEHVLPGVRFAVDAYLNFVRRADWREGAISSLTELFAPEIHQSRLESWPQHYPWIDAAGYGYFRKRLNEARRDVDHGLEVALDICTNYQAQQRALDILQFKLDVLWSMLDAMSMAYQLGRPPYHSVTDERVYHRGLA